MALGEPSLRSLQPCVPEPVGLQSWTLRGRICQGQVFKAGIPHVGFKCSAPWGAQRCGTAPTSLQPIGVVYGKIASQPFLPASMWGFFVCVFFFHLPDV